MTNESTPVGALPVADGRMVTKVLWAATSSQRGLLVVVVALFVLTALVGLVFPMMVGVLVDTVTGGDRDWLPWSLAGLVSAAFAAGVLSWASGVALAHSTESVIARLREDYVSSALRLPRSTVERAGTGDLVTRASTDVAEVSESLPGIRRSLVSSVVTIVIAGLGLGVIDPRFLLGFVITVPFYVLTVRWYVRIAPPVYQAERAAFSVRGQHVLGTLGQLRSVLAHRLEARQRRRVQDATWQTARWAMRARIVQNRMYTKLDLGEFCGLIAVLAVGVWLAAAGEATPGQVTAAVMVFLSMVSPINGLMYVMDDLQAAFAALARIVGVHVAADTDQPVVQPTSDADGPLVVAESVDFAYVPQVPVLNDVSLTVPEGCTVAVVGATGSGKSTLAALIAGVHEPDGGRVERGIPASRIVTVTQEVHVFHGTLRDNLTLAAPAADDETVRRALDAVSAGDLIDALPRGLDTLVGEGEHQLSAADAQHLALARVLLADPALVVLDEATADADTADADALERGASAVVAGRGAVVIAHRLSQAASADEIIVLERGRIVERGSHDALRARGGVYASLWSAWERASERE